MILLQSDYSFTAVTREIDFSGGTFNGIELQQIKVIANVTDDVIIYKFNNPAFGGTLAADVLTLAFDTTSMSDSDVLMIIVETNRDYDQLYQIRQYTSNLDTSLSSVIDGITGISTKTLSDIYDLLDAGIAVTVDTSLLATASKQDAQTALLTTIDGDTSNLDVLLSTRLKPADTLAGVTTVGAVTAITNALPAGNNNIGDVDIASIAAGTNLIGKVSIDQVTANANEVVTKTGSTTVVSSITAALPAGTNAIGKLAANSGVDIGDVDVTSLPALVAGSAIIGKVGIDQTTPGTTNLVALTAETTKVIGVVRNSDGAGNLLTSNSTTPTAKFSLDQNITSLLGTAIDVNSGNKSAGTQRMVVATDQPNLTTPLNVTIQSAATGGDTTFHLVSAATTNATNIKASAGKVTGWFIYNSNAAARKLVFHNTAGTPTAGASVFFAIVIPATSGANVSFPDGIDFSTGIGITTVTGLADSDSAAVALNDLIINIFYK